MDFFQSYVLYSAVELEGIYYPLSLSCNEILEMNEFSSRFRSAFKKEHLVPPEIRNKYHLCIQYLSLAEGDSSRSVRAPR